MGLGNKILRGVSKIGQKANNTINSIGKKTMSTLNKVDSGVNKALNFTDNIAQKSGDFTNVLRKGANITDKIITGLNNSGVGNLVPYGNQVLSAANKASRYVKQGAEKIDEARDKYEDVRNKIDVEKMNVRKRIEDTVNKANEISAGFV